MNLFQRHITAEGAIEWAIEWEGVRHAALTGSTVLVSRDLRRTMSLAALAAAAACCAAVALSKIAPRI